MGSKRNLLAGEAYEVQLILQFDKTGLFPELIRSQVKHKALDAKKLDIITKNKSEAIDFGLAIQAKNTTKYVPYVKLLNELIDSRPDFTPVVFHRKTQRVENTTPPRYLTELEVAILRQEDFIKVLEEATRYKRGYRAIMEYWDSLSKESQSDLDEELKNIGL